MKGIVVLDHEFKSSQLGSNTSLFVKIEAITINAFLPTRNNFVYSWKSMLQDLMKKAFSASRCLWKCLLWKKVVEMLEEVVVSWWEIRWMLDEVRLCSPICSTFAMLVVQCVVSVVSREELNPFCLPIPAADIAVFSVSRWFAEHTSQIVMLSSGFRKLQWIRTAADYQAMIMTFFLVQVWLW